MIEGTSQWLRSRPFPSEVAISEYIPMCYFRSLPEFVCIWQCWWYDCQDGTCNEEFEVINYAH